MRILTRVAYVLGLPVVLVLLWWVLTIDSTNFFVPEPGELAATFVDTWIGPRFREDVLPSVARFTVGTLLAIVLGVAAGLLIGSVRWLRSLLEPMLEFFRALPPPVLVPVLMLLIGVDNRMKVLVIVFGAIWPVLLNTVEGVRAVDPVLVDTARTYGLTRLTRLRTLVLPSAAPQIAAGVRQALSIGLILMVISEMFASSSGLGFTIVVFQRSFAVVEMWSGIVLLGLIGVAVSIVFQACERRVLHWYYGQKEVQHGR
ncbi:ABC transporter permease [Mumia sp. zg.B17]|uniref:ABC transporter permease n=1 Tax=unclassified Mumia TaxID=2621872 RepID=UPI001C6F4BB8|nr:MULTISPECIES: ABC transporter permease [unclassified Mumia]MBW9207601.1 ABC transporter permease [Mumia sp. zg.B17]MBW9210053.1 ABC transporter permease [Mumia sp. zg.B21]